jgi:hypothetical protein
VADGSFNRVFRSRYVGFRSYLVTGLIEISGMIAVTLLFDDISKALSRSLSLLAASLGQIVGGTDSL